MPVSAAPSRRWLTSGASEERGDGGERRRGARERMVQSRPAEQGQGQRDHGEDGVAAHEHRVEKEQDDRRGRRQRQAPAGEPPPAGKAGRRDQRRRHLRVLEDDAFPAREKRPGADHEDRSAPPPAAALLEPHGEQAEPADIKRGLQDEHWRLSAAERQEERPQPRHDRRVPILVGAGHRLMILIDRVVHGDAGPPDGQNRGRQRQRREARGQRPCRCPRFHDFRPAAPPIDCRGPR